MNILASVRNWLTRLFWSVRPGEVQELQWPDGATSRLLYRSKSDPKWGIVGHIMPDGKFYPIHSATPWEQTPDWNLEWIKPRPVEKSQAEHDGMQSEAKPS